MAKATTAHSSYFWCLDGKKVNGGMYKSKLKTNERIFGIATIFIGKSINS